MSQQCLQFHQMITSVPLSVVLSIHSESLTHSCHPHLHAMRRTTRFSEAAGGVVVSISAFIVAACWALRSA